jgi:hypothetical protein
MFDIYDLFDEFDTDIVVVSDFDIITNGVRVDCILQNPQTNKIEIWAGNPVEDKYAEELVLSKAERKRIFEEILENF